MKSGVDPLPDIERLVLLTTILTPEKESSAANRLVPGTLQLLVCDVVALVVGQIYHVSC